MILFKLRDYLKQQGQASLQELAQHLKSDPEALRAMLEHLIHKNQVYRSATLNGRCGGCTQCDPNSLEIYYWGQKSVDLIIKSNSTLKLLDKSDCLSHILPSPQVKNR